MLVSRNAIFGDNTVALGQREELNAMVRTFLISGFAYTESERLWTLAECPGCVIAQQFMSRDVRPEHETTISHLQSKSSAGHRQEAGAHCL